MRKKNKKPIFFEKHTALDGSRIEAIRMGSSRSKWLECIFAACSWVWRGVALDNQSNCKERVINKDSKFWRERERLVYRPKLALRVRLPLIVETWPFRVRRICFLFVLQLLPTLTHFSFFNYYNGQNQTIKTGFHRTKNTLFPYLILTLKYIF